jgi:hypothetical protein
MLIAAGKPFPEVLETLTGSLTARAKLDVLTELLRGAYRITWDAKGRIPPEAPRLPRRSTPRTSGVSRAARASSSRRSSAPRPTGSWPAETERDRLDLEVADREAEWIGAALRDFARVWKRMTPENQGRLLRALVAAVRRITPDRARPIASRISRSFAIAERGLQRIQQTERRIGDRESAQREQLRQLAASVVDRLRAQLDTLESALPTRP